MMDSPIGSTFKQLPRSKLAWWSVGLAAVYLLLALGDMVIIMLVSKGVNIPTGGPIISFGFLLILSGLAAGITGIIAVKRNHERSWLTWLAILPGVFMVFLLLGELIFPH
jgi:hypothetical protein